MAAASWRRGVHATDHSRGRWEGTTLVVETTNLNGYIWMDDSGNFYTDTARLTERMTMIDPDVIHYEVTIETHSGRRGRTGEERVGI